MPKLHSLPSRWPVSLIIITTLFGVIICIMIVYLFYVIVSRRRKALMKMNMPRQDRRPSRATSENSQVELQSDRVHFGLDIAGRLPVLRTNDISVKSEYPSFHNAVVSGSNSQSNHLHQSVIISVMEPTLHPTVGHLETHLEKSGGNPRKEARTSVQSLRDKIDQSIPSETPVAIQLTPTLGAENNGKIMKRCSIYSPSNEQETGLPLVEMSGGQLEEQLSWTDSIEAFDLARKNEQYEINGFEKLPELVRVVPSAIVETVEKQKPSQVIRKKLLSLVSSNHPSSNNQQQQRGGLLGKNCVTEEKEIKYYWEMMQVECNDTWWQLPFPPHLSPIDTNFQLAE